MFGTTHHSAFDKWWEYAAKNYVSWDGAKPVALDLYYDPVVDEHVARGPMGIVAPAWYFAPQRPEVAQAGWLTAASIYGVLGGGPIVGLDHPERAISLLQFSGEFADEATKQRVWDAADEHIQPTWDRQTGEFNLGLGLNEAHPRGQLNARAMAGWVCTPGAWSRIFNAPNLAKFEEPTVEGVDFPRVALSEARWDGKALHVAVHPQNSAVAGTRTSVRITHVDSAEGWVMTQPSGDTIELPAAGNHVRAELVADNQSVTIWRK